MDIIFILVRPAVPENTGASARALNTMGFNNLRIVNPRHDFPGGKVKIVAHGSFNILEKAALYNSMEEAVADLDFVVGTSSKKRRTNEEYIAIPELSSFLNSKEHLKKIGIVFGREESGLTKEEMRLCDLISFIPLSKPYPSLNLSHAVMIYAYELSGLKNRDKTIQTAVPEDELKVLKTKVDKILRQLDLNKLSVIGPRVSERMSYLEKADVRILHSIANAFLEKYRN